LAALARTRPNGPPVGFGSKADVRERSLVSVEDDGPGVPDDQIGSVLARGGRLDEAQPGTGLGLAIARELTEGYGGSLSLKRSSLGGLSVEVCFPQEAEEQAS